MPEVVNTTPLSGLGGLPEEPDRETMIAVDNVSMVFNMASEQLNSLKEYAIALARKELRFKEFRALDGITLDIKRGDVFGILGTNGSGKSTLLKIIAGVLEPTEGTCSINGSIAPLIELGAGFDMELTARENIFLNGALLGYSKKFIQDSFDDIVEFAEIEQFLDMPLKNYSSGMVARIAFAIATVIVPDILIVDEVLSVGDFMFQKKCEERIQSLIKEHNVTVLIVSHNNDQIERLCNKAVWIEKGHMRMLGTARDVCQTYRVLGGHVGSKESEDCVFQTLVSPVEPDEGLTQSIEADSRYGLAAKLIERTHDDVADTVILVSGEHDMDSFLVTGLAGALDAPILLIRDESIPDATVQEIKRLRASKAIFAGKPEYCPVDRLAAMLKSALEHELSIEALTADTYQDLSFAIFDYGHQRGLWQGPAVCTYVGCTGDLISLSPYMHRHRCPLFLKVQGTAFEKPAIERILSLGQDRVLVLDSPQGCRDAELAPLTNAGVATVRLCGKNAHEANKTICDWIERDAGGVPCGSYIIASYWNPANSYLLGLFASKTGSLIVLEDPQNLDSVASSIRYFEQRQGAIRALIFVGSRTQYAPLDKTILAKAASASLSSTSNC